MPKTKIPRVGTVGGNNIMEMFTSSNNRRPSQGQGPGHLIIALRPLLISMTLVGILDYWAIVENDGRTGRFRKGLLRFYRITIGVIFVSNFVRYFSAYAGASGFEAKLLSNIFMHVLFLQTAVSTIVCFIIAENPRKLQHFVALWDAHSKRTATTASENSAGEKETLSICKSLRKASVICLIFGWVVIAGMILFCYYSLYYTDTFDDVITPLSSSHPQADIAKAVYVVLSVFMAGVWCFTAILMFLVHLTLYYGVKQFARKMDELKSKTLKEAHDNMEQFRTEHNDWCEMIAVADDSFHLIAGNSLFTSILCILILVYNMCWYETVRSSPVQLVTHLYWLSGIITMLSVLMSACCLVNKWAHAPAKSIYNLTFKGYTGDVALQVNAFLHRLNGSPIGLSALGLFVIDKTVVVSVGGMLATYFVVLLQFQQSSVTPSAGVNGTTAVV